MVPWSTRGQTEKQCRHLSTTFIPRMFFSLVAQSYPTLSDSMDCSTPGFPVHRQLPEFAQTHVHWVGDAIQPSHPLSSPSPPAFSLSQHQGLFQGVSSLHQVAKVLEFQLQHQSFQWIFRTDFLPVRASLTLWTWVWVNSGSWWWTGRPGVLRFMGVAKSQTRLSNWTELIHRITGKTLFVEMPIQKTRLRLKVLEEKFINA